jgi:hypothetical protein
MAIWQSGIAKYMLAILATSYHLNRKDRVSNFYWTKGSKQCFLTCFSYFIRYFRILVFSRNRYLLISSRLSRLYWNLISCPVSRTNMRLHVSGTERMGFSKQDACGNLVVASLPVNFPFLPFAEGFWCERPLDWTQIIPFFLSKILQLTLSYVT